MTVLHIINYVLPIGCMVAIGFWLDHLCKPNKETIEQQAE